jgi:hypothetical protein
MERRSGVDRRATELADVTSDLLLEGGKRQGGQVLDLNAHAATLRLRGVSFAALPVGRRYTVELGGAWLPEPVRLAAQLRYKVQEGDSIRIALVFAQADVAWPLLHEAFGGRVNRRQHARVKPDPNRPLSARLRAWLTEPNPLEGDVEVVDLSLGGLGLILRDPFHDLLRPSQGVELRVRLPDHDLPVAVAARVRHCAGVPGGWHCGVQFTGAVADAAESAASPLQSYIDSCTTEVPEV